MSKGFFDDVFDENNRLVRASEISKANESDIFGLEIIYLVCNTAWTIFLIMDNQPRIATNTSLVLLGVNVLPVAWSKISFYHALSELSDNKILARLAKTIRISIIFIVIPVIFCVWGLFMSTSHFFNFAAILTTIFFAVIGAMDKTINFYTSKSVRIKSPKE